ncbi:hypothetical protein CEP52_012266 [Fusarium oligoseptatum]|uniref:Uncharacterized protein n=1 Tax=Fusarium oligoseptatum TaxID=2604345 RepID=A0A428SZ35_9HYPO|nr:hypothetical protein CEP52_012266 [Fusarium oligoseptatum]
MPASNTPTSLLVHTGSTSSSTRTTSPAPAQARASQPPAPAPSHIFKHMGPSPTPSTDDLGIDLDAMYKGNLTPLQKKTPDSRCTTVTQQVLSS